MSQDISESTSSAGLVVVRRIDRDVAEAFALSQSARTSRSATGTRTLLPLRDRPTPMSRSCHAVRRGWLSEAKRAVGRSRMSVTLRYLNQSEKASPPTAYIPITRPSIPLATSLERSNHQVGQSQGMSRGVPVAEHVRSSSRRGQTSPPGPALSAWRVASGPIRARTITRSPAVACRPEKPSHGRVAGTTSSP